jgi:hypothetical protein
LWTICPGQLRTVILLSSWDCMCEPLVPVFLLFLKQGLEVIPWPAWTLIFHASLRLEVSGVVCLLCKHKALSCASFVVGMTGAHHHTQLLLAEMWGEGRSHELFCLGWPWNALKIIGMIHWCHVVTNFDRCY